MILTTLVTSWANNTVNVYMPGIPYKYDQLKKTLAHAQGYN